MLDRLLNLVVKATNIQPAYTPEHCLAVTRQSGGCTVCRDICPHEAVTIDRQVQIDDIDCTGCGLCVRACPSQALEAKVSYQPGAPLKCSQVKGSAQTVQCLARLEPSDLLQLAGRRDSVTLAHHDCASCPIGGEAVLDAIKELVEEAESLAEFRKRKLEFRVLTTRHLDDTDDPDPISRRDFFRGGWRSLQHSASDALAPLDPGGSDDEDLPREMQWTYRLIERAQPEPETPVPWVLPRIAEGCIMCPTCTNVCPTDAFRREFDPLSKGGGATLKLEPDRCNGCNACVKSCPVGVISLDDVVTWSELSSGTIDAYWRESGQGAGGTISRGPHVPASKPEKE